MSSKKNEFKPRKGQKDLIEYLPSIRQGETLVIQWPTGYGKSVGFALAWKHCSDRRLANRFLIIVANDTQRQQIINDFAEECIYVEAPCNGGIWSFERSASDIQAAIQGTAEIFVCTVQQLDASNRGGLNTLKELLTATGTQWMIGFDELHHYGQEMAWGDAAKIAMQYASFIMAMSATPYRRGPETIFPDPKHIISYSDAVAEKAVKPMICHSYEYRVTVIDDGGECEYTTTELLEEAPEGIDQWEERRNIRYSPEYIHPLITHPLTRLIQKRAETGQRLQMLIRAMSCAHAEMVCRQVKLYAGDGLTVDWIGTGPNGRNQEINDSIRRAFCPPKQGGKRPSPNLDILVQVSMAGEGFDSVNVAEIVDLFPVSKKAISGRATADKQFYGRGSRIIEGWPDVPLHVSVPSDHPLYRWAGLALHRWMDSAGSDVQPREDDKQREFPEIDLFDFPDLPRTREIELLNITTEDEHFKVFAKKASQEPPRGVREYDFERDKEYLFKLYREAATGTAKQQAAQARLVQVKAQLDCIVGRIAHIQARNSPVLNGSVIGHYKNKLNGAIKRQFRKSRDEMLTDELERAYTWCQNYLRSLRGK